MKENIQISEPMLHLNEWILEERKKGVHNPQQAILSTSTPDAIPHARVVVIQKISELGLVFLTHKDTKKVCELKANPFGVLTFWFEFLERQIIIDGKVESLSDNEINDFWQKKSKDKQIEFYSYSSMHSTSKKAILNEKKRIKQVYDNLSVPLNPSFCGFRLIPNKILFYDCNTEGISQIIDYQFIDGYWQKKFLAPYALRTLI